tara:strand:- start:1048 stop:1260 length:213 start_codon:yes stop_codon:yes gene_type:complete
MLNIKAFIEDVLNLKSCCNQERDKNTLIIPAKKYRGYSSKRCIDENDIKNEITDLMKFKQINNYSNRTAI